MKIKGLLVTLLALVLLAGCAKDSKDAPIKIGVPGAQSGDLASYGIPTVRAVEIYAELWNKKGGVLGRQIQVLAEDESCKPELATNVAAKLVGEKVDGIIGHICSGTTKAAMGIYRDAKIVAITPSATSNDLTDSGEYPNFFRAIAKDSFQAVTAAKLVSSLGFKQVAILHDKGDYGKSFATAVKDILEKEGNVKVTLFDGITVGAVDYSAILNKVGGAGAEAVVFGGYHPEASKLVTQMKKSNMDIAFISDDGVKDDTFIQVAKEFAEGVYATGPQDTSSSTMAQEAIKLHEEKYGEKPGAFFLNACAAIESLLKAIEIAGTTDYDAVRKALQSNKFDTTLGKIGFSQTGDPIGVEFTPFQVVNGKYVEVKY
ncbi:MAG: branched-chain amino acid ABC transporter substrate-binding protein [Spirochaetales bacterium]|nr:branched-chain amino acid ABC transporter substrate-binding protein [Spirochaetales bacterium]